ncbi:hypothetical protein RHGRI_015891 [Rhododendron griersonianum]|uniref:Uncharacterized protein n=1 Tax=Rhododendron griersonianum TaxID=479676 RepID=A0AAV6JSH1_9ERIC|nr:hypothetical protein RHGRI_015891 [Rhododendron griersonianum]
MRVQEMEKHVVISAPYSSMREQDMEEHIVIVGGGIAGPSTALGLNRGYESRCVRRKELLETLERELPHGTIRYSSKVVSIEGRGYHKFLHLADGSTLKAKDAIGVLENKEEDIVIVGAGMAGSTTALGLHRFMGLVECDGR